MILILHPPKFNTGVCFTEHELLSKKYVQNSSELLSETDPSNFLFSTTILEYEVLEYYSTCPEENERKMQEAFE